eukprot:CAMPEP_0169064572 /NCGR_PEP_ID=MMETSP1015-20121227/1914_1 /TAXON_ID=342587 /ORGANISM="Karlodinium micrum, Strain CCMP2283" /LENGTH=139 /DNA_ID=CAMNT_0009123033 /DNA_START=392 /DNA_END=811 /DNA_ORIENTATION=+
MTPSDDRQLEVPQFRPWLAWSIQKLLYVLAASAADRAEWHDKLASTKTLRVRIKFCGSLTAGDRRYTAFGWRSNVDQENFWSSLLQRFHHFRGKYSLHIIVIGFDFLFIKYLGSSKTFPIGFCNDALLKFGTRITSYVG